MLSCTYIAMLPVSLRPQYISLDGVISIDNNVQESMYISAFVS